MNRAVTAEEDRILLEGRAAGRSWLELAKEIGITGKTCQIPVVPPAADPRPEGGPGRQEEPAPAVTG